MRTSPASQRVLAHVADQQPEPLLVFAHDGFGVLPVSHIKSHADHTSTDPPYYDNIGYAALSDFFYVWLRRTVGACIRICSARSLSPRARNSPAAGLGTGPPAAGGPHPCLPGRDPTPSGGSDPCLAGRLNHTLGGELGATGFCNIRKAVSTARVRVMHWHATGECTIATGSSLRSDEADPAFHRIALRRAYSAAHPSLKKGG